MVDQDDYRSARRRAFEELKENLARQIEETQAAREEAEDATVITAIAMGFLFLIGLGAVIATVINHYHH